MKRLQRQMRSDMFDAFRSTSVIIFSSEDRFACHTKGIQNFDAVWLFHVIMKGSSGAPAHCAPMIGTHFIVEYAWSDWRYFANVRRSGKRSLPNLHHQYYHQWNGCHVNELQSNFDCRYRPVCKALVAQSLTCGEVLDEYVLKVVCGEVFKSPSTIAGNRTGGSTQGEHHTTWLVTGRHCVCVRREPMAFIKRGIDNCWRARNGRRRRGYPSGRVNDI